VITKPNPYRAAGLQCVFETIEPTEAISNVKSSRFK
jgi:hypothetical protein